MRAVIQRVKHAGVLLPDGSRPNIGQGLMVLLGVGKNDTEKEAIWLAAKTAQLRIFSNDEGKFDLSVKDVKGEILVVSQFTLYGDAHKGRRPDFTAAALPPQAIPLYEKYVSALKVEGLPVFTGEFGAHMEVDLLNDGPVTIIIEKEPS